MLKPFPDHSLEPKPLNKDYLLYLVKGMDKPIGKVGTTERMTLKASSEEITILIIGTAACMTGVEP